MDKHLTDTNKRSIADGFRDVQNTRRNYIGFVGNNTTGAYSYQILYDKLYIVYTIYTCVPGLKFQTWKLIYRTIACNLSKTKRNRKKEGLKTQGRNLL